jgi:hypothetical protein
MTEHLTDDQLRAYANRGLKGAALLAGDDHLASCAACEQRLRALPLDAEAALPRHIDDALIEKLASGTLSEDDQTLIDLHTSACAACRERWAFLRGEDDARGTVVQFNETAASTSPRRLATRTAAAVAAAVVLLFGVLLISRRPATIPVATATPTVTHPATAAPVPPIAVTSAEPASTAAPAATIVLRDAHGDVTASGSAVAGIPAGSWRDDVEAVLRKQSLRFLSTAALATPPLILRGGGDAPAVTAVPKFPVATAVESDRPRFRWTAPAGNVVRVSIFTPDTQRIAQSGWLRAREWQVSTALARGATFVWQLENRASEDALDGTVSAPARFRVLTSAAASEVARARATGSHLVLGTVAAAHGVIDLAVAELRLLRTLNPDSPLVAALYADALRVQRAAPTATKDAQKNG